MEAASPTWFSGTLTPGFFPVRLTQMEMGAVGRVLHEFPAEGWLVPVLWRTVRLHQGPPSVREVTEILEVWVEAVPARANG